MGWEQDQGHDTLRTLYTRTITCLVHSLQEKEELLHILVCVYMYVAIQAANGSPQGSQHMNMYDVHLPGSSDAWPGDHCNGTPSLPVSRGRPSHGRVCGEAVCSQP